MNHTIGRVDFNDSVRIVTVPAGQRVEDITVDIPIIDDEIDEASEGFVILLEVVDPAVAPFVDLFTRNASLGRIDDNDSKCICYQTVMLCSLNFSSRVVESSYCEVTINTFAEQIAHTAKPLSKHSQKHN